jgi:DNA-binding transcriptional ArsR family regulator
VVLDRQTLEFTASGSVDADVTGMEKIGAIIDGNTRGDGPSDSALRAVARAGRPLTIVRQQDICLTNTTLQRYLCIVSKRPPDLDVTAVRALAHPLRLRLLDLLRFDGPATATLLASRVGESSGSTSYHLRQLARHGFIEEVAKRGGRERWWRYRERRGGVDNADSSNVRALLGELLSREAYALDRYLSVTARDPAWDEAAFFQTRALRLTAGELEELSGVLHATFARFRSAACDDVPPEALPVRVLAFGFPQPRERS